MGLVGRRLRVVAMCYAPHPAPFQAGMTHLRTRGSPRDMADITHPRLPRTLASMDRSMFLRSRVEASTRWVPPWNSEGSPSLSLASPAATTPSPFNGSCQRWRPPRRPVGTRSQEAPKRPAAENRPRAYPKIDQPIPPHPKCARPGQTSSRRVSTCATPEIATLARA